MRLEELDGAGDGDHGRRARQEADRPSARCRAKVGAAAVSQSDRLRMRAHLSMIASERRRIVRWTGRTGRWYTSVVNAQRVSVRLAVSVAAVAIVTVAIFGLKAIAPVL